MSDAGVPADRRIEFRIGIHLGDVVEEVDGDLMGDGVNIAARLEGVAEPGAICLSEDAYRQVRPGSISPSAISARRT
ncbi:MAG TPA: adenylate/guanylate cyclase domain-containing protein [Roseiarcus sp.]|nr:adenylate/guanylate cyclase domain-containing protein [Roseiarcus sp.]